MKRFEKTSAQQQALKLLQSSARHILLYGGSRSGKTFILIYALLARALKAPGSRHAVLRFHGNGARYAVGFDTLPKVAALAFPGLKLNYSKSDNFFLLPNRYTATIRPIRMFFRKISVFQTPCPTPLTILVA